MRKKLQLFFLLVILCHSVIGQADCTPVFLKIEYEQGISGRLYIATNELSELIVDTVLLDGNPKSIRDCISGPRQYVITVDAPHLATTSFPVYIEQSTELLLTLQKSGDSIVHSFKGSRTHEEWTMYDNSVAQIMQLENYADSLLHFSKKFIKVYNHSYVSGTIIALYAAEWSADTIAHYLNLLTPVARTYAYASFAEKIMLRKKDNSVGAPMRFFTGIDNRQQPFSSNLVKGKTILLEFWASWCAPCRESFPALQEMIKVYQPHGLEVIGISEDMDADPWLKAIDTDRLQNWHHILSGLKDDVLSKGPEKRISYQFGVTCFPTRILVNSKGIIIGRWEGEDKKNSNELRVLLSNIFDAR